MCCNIAVKETKQIRIQIKIRCPIVIFQVKAFCRVNLQELEILSRKVLRLVIIQVSESCATIRGIGTTFSVVVHCTWYKNKLTNGWFYLCHLKRHMVITVVMPIISFNFARFHNDLQPGDIGPSTKTLFLILKYFAPELLDSSQLQ